MQGYTLSYPLIVGREECRGTLFLSSISNSRESNSVGVHSFLPVSKQAEKSAGVHSFFPVLVKLGRAIVWGGVHSFLPVNKQAEKSAGVHSFFAIMRILCTEGV